MKKGFITIATGDERYYRMARTLVRSYRKTSTNPMPFAIICDRENEYTAEFDCVVLLGNPTFSWLDKIKLLECCPYDENIFVDADCTIYNDINFFWDLFKTADDFSCFGKVLPMDSKEGWFTSDAARVYPIRFITHLHGICYFIRPGEMVDRMVALSCDIIRNYSAVQYKGFNDCLADEPVFALAMAILGLKPIEREPHYYCFVPYATHINTNFYTREVDFRNPKDGWVRSCFIVHWGNQNTKRAQYRFDAHIINNMKNRNMSKVLSCLLFDRKLLLHMYRAQDLVHDWWSKIAWFVGRVWKKLREAGRE